MRIKERGCHERTAFAIGNISRVVCAERLGVTQVRRDHGINRGVLYRIRQNRKAIGTELSLRKMLHHLQLKARVVRTGNSFVVEANPTAQPAAASQDW